jgi:hypothetical protein
LFSEKDSQSTIWATDAAVACIFRCSGGGNMADFDRIKRLEIAGQFCLFDKRLRSSGNSSIIWGVLNLLIAASGLALHNRWAIVSLLLGTALIAAGMYERSVRDPKVIIISAGTLAGLALWNLALVGLAAAGKVQLALGGRTLYWAIAQGIGAFTTWKTYSTYKVLRDESDPSVVQQVREYIDEIKKAKPTERLDLVEFEVNAGFVQGTKRYRLLPVEDLYLTARFKSQLRSLTLEEVSFVPRNAVMLTPEGEKWMSKKLKASVQLGPLKLEKVTIQPEMAARLTPGAPVPAMMS